MLFEFNALRVRQMDRKNDTAPLNRKCDHCLRSSHRLEICGSPISGLFVRLWYKLSRRGGCRFVRYGGFWKPLPDPPLKGRGQKVVRNGQIYILRGEKVYNAQGALVK